MNENYFKKIFVTHKVDVPDDGFSGRVIRKLPERNSVLPQIVMVTFVVIGLALMFATSGLAHFLEQINSLLISVSQLKMPMPSAIIAYISALALTSLIGFSVAQADAG
jgi:hypothetical protein